MADTDSFAASWAEAEARHEARKPANQSRVEAVRAALEWAANRGLNICDERTAKAVIDANDAWLDEARKVQAWVCPRCGVLERCPRYGEQDCRGCGEPIPPRIGVQP